MSGLAGDADRHLILVTATPHSGKEAAFRSLLSFLDPGFSDLPDDLTGPGQEPLRHRIAAHFVQRRRADIRNYLDADTPFPKREDSETSYMLSPDYKRLFDRVLAYARESVQEETASRFRQRVRWWSALALLRSLASSPGRGRGDPAKPGGDRGYRDAGGGGRDRAADGAGPGGGRTGRRGGRGAWERHRGDGR